MRAPIRVLIVDDHAIVREGLRMLLSDEADLAVVGEAADGLEALALAERLAPDVILMDLRLPKLDGLAVTRQLQQQRLSSQVIVLTGSIGDDLRVREAIQAGAIGYLLKDVLKADLLRAIRSAAEGKPTLHPEAQHELMRQATAPPLPHETLTGRERDVLRLLAQGQSNKKIAAALNLSEGTVKGYVSIILDKLNVADRTQAALYSVRQGLDKDR